ncbi:MAG: hypothetical protein AB8I08_31270 [Sandaracinaceae bacterium]
MRGSILVDQLTQIERCYGADVIESALARLTPAQADEVRGTVSVSWLNVTTVTAFKTAVAEELGQDPLDFQREVVRAALGDTISTMWRALLSKLWDSAIVKRTPLLYSKTFDRGEMTLSEIEGTTATFVLTGWPDIPEYDCVGLSTGIEALLDYAGRKPATVRWSREAGKVLFCATWTAR